MTGIKVTQILYPGLGGHGSVVFSLINADQKNEWQHQLIFYGIEGLLPAYKNFCDKKRLPYALILKQRGFFRSRFFALYKALRRQKPDVVILHSPTISLHIKFYCFFHRKKMIVVEHTSNQGKRRGEWIGTFFSLITANKIVYLSQKYQQEIKEKFRWFNVLKRSVVVPNGIALDKYKPCIKPETDCLHLGMAGRFYFTKNQLFLTKAILDFLQEKSDQLKINLHFAGIGEKYKEVKNTIEESEFQDYFHLHGLLTEDEMLKFYEQLDIYVHASSSETMCTAVMQAMACGIPVVGSNISGINNLVQNDITGLLFENDNPEELISCISVLATDRNKRLQMGWQARKYAEDNFSSLVTFDKYHSLVKSE